MIEPTGSLTLSGLEVVFLQDSLRNGETIKAIEDEVSELRPLVLNLGSAYVELVNESGISDGPVRIEVTKAQCWLMRAKVRTGDLAIDGKTNVGVGLLSKLYSLLFSFESGLSDLEVSAYESPPMTDEAIAALKDERYERWRPDERSFKEP